MRVCVKGCERVSVRRSNTATVLCIKTRNLCMSFNTARASPDMEPGIFDRMRRQRGRGGKDSDCGGKPKKSYVTATRNDDDDAFEQHASFEHQRDDTVPFCVANQMPTAKLFDAFGVAPAFHVAEADEDGEAEEAEVANLQMMKSLSFFDETALTQTKRMEAPPLPADVQFFSLPRCLADPPIPAGYDSKSSSTA